MALEVMKERKYTRGVDSCKTDERETVRRLGGGEFGGKRIKLLFRGSSVDFKRVGIEVLDT